MNRSQAWQQFHECLNRRLELTTDFEDSEAFVHSLMFVPEIEWWRALIYCPNVDSYITVGGTQQHKESVIRNTANV